MSDSGAGPVLGEDRDEHGVVTLTLQRPQVRNAFDAALIAAVTEAATRLAADDTVRAVVLTGAGAVFSAGADLNWMLAAGEGDAGTVDDSRAFESMLRAVHELPMPVLARVNGHAIAGASGLVACADVAVAVRGAKFGFTEVRLGLVPAMISAYVQPRIGVANAHRYFLTGEVFDADRAHALGLVHEVCEPHELDEVVAGLLGTLVAAGPQGQRATKRLIGRIAATPSPADSEQLRLETIARARASEEAQARIRTFLADRD